MPTFDITYETSNYYIKPIREAIYELMVLPGNFPGQRCLSHQIVNSLEIRPQYSDSLFGSQLIRFRVPKKFCTFNVTVNSTVMKDDINPFDIEQLTPSYQEQTINDKSFKIDNFRYLIASEFTTLAKETLRKEVKRLPEEELFLYMQRINNWVYTHVRYQVGVTNTQTKLDEVVRIMAGVCQDFAHLYIHIMRANGIPARYVSGYLNQGKSFAGNAAMHAWAETLLPGIGWIGFDPSNNLLVNSDYLKIGHGLDYSDCMPIKGVLVAMANGFTEYSVKVVEQQTQ